MRAYLTYFFELMRKMVDSYYVFLALLTVVRVRHLTFCSRVVLYGILELYLTWLHSLQVCAVFSCGVVQISLIMSNQRAILLF